MNAKERCVKWLAEVNHHLAGELVPFWLTHGVDSVHGGYQPQMDRLGNPTGETDKAMLNLARMIYTYSSMHRAGHGDGQALTLARHGVDFLLAHLWDEKYGGWNWTCTRDGQTINASKLIYGHSFVIYALSEYAMAAPDDPRGLEWALKTFETIQTLAADNCHGGYYEFLEEDWSKKRPGVYGGDRKGMDVHMHLMEALTNLYEATQNPRHKEKTLEIIDLLFAQIIHPQCGTGMAQFTFDWTPLRAILFKDVWGADRDADNQEGRPLNNTSFGHNVEFAWLLIHAIEVLGLDVDDYKERLHKIFDHAVKNGIDWERGGVFCEGPHDDGRARERNKEFWQQAECLVGFLRAFLLFGDKRYLDAYENVHRFVMDYVINHDVGEWLRLFDEHNKLLWADIGTLWKDGYHTVRSMILCRMLLKRIIAG